MAGKNKTTTDHEEIRKWAETRGGQPTSVEGTEDILRIDFDRLRPIDWDEFFEAFEKHQLAFLYQDETEDGQESRFCKFVKR